MKTKITLILTGLFLLVLSCKNDDDSNNNVNEPTLIGTWQLIEIYGDPGDGSGGFEPVDSDKSISFFENGTLTSNGSLCNMSNQAGDSTNGTYNTEESVILPSDCSFENYQIFFEIENSNLILSYPCIEACNEKYIKLN